MIETGIDEECLPIGYKFIEDGIVYDEKCDETAESLICDDVRKREVETSGIGGSSEVGGGQVQRSEVEESEPEGIDVEKSEVGN